MWIWSLDKTIYFRTLNEFYSIQQFENWQFPIKRHADVLLIINDAAMIYDIFIDRAVKNQQVTH